MHSKKCSADTVDIDDINLGVECHFTISITETQLSEIMFISLIVIKML